MLGRELMKFLIAHPNNWEELLSSPPYNLIIRKKDDYVLFKYSMIESDFDEEIVNEARGIIFAHRAGTWKIVRFAFPKFWNWGESRAAEINWASFSVSEKLDGSLISVWFDNDEWHVSTSGTIDAYEADVMGRKFGDLFDIAAKNVGLNLEDLCPNYCYTFEMVGPLNKIVVAYPETTLYHLSTRDMLTLDEVEVDIGVPKPLTYEATCLEDVQAIVAAMGEDHEGVVVRDAQGRRIKMKTELYFRLHKLANNGSITDKYLVDLIRHNDVAELEVYFPEVKARVEELKVLYNNVRAAFHEIEETVKNFCGDRKTFALMLHEKIPKPLHVIYFRAFDGKIWEFFRDMKLELLMSFMEYFKEV